MADKKISELPASSALDLDDFLAVVEDGTTVQATIEDILALSTTSGLPDGYSIPEFTQSVTTNQTTTMTAAINDLPADGGTVLIPAGTFYTQILPASHPGVTFRGAGAGATTIVAPNSSPIIETSGTRGDLTFEDLTFDMGPNTAAGAMVVYPEDRNTTFRRCRFEVYSYGVAPNGAVDPVFEDCEFFPAVAPGDSGGTALFCAAGVRGLRWIRSKVRFMRQGIVFDSTPHDDIDINGGLFDGGWYVLPTRSGGYTNSGGTVTYTATTVVDSAASFGAIPNPYLVNIRALPTLESGSTGTTYSTNYLDDSTALFVTALVKPGHIVRTATKWAVVERVISETRLQVEEWFDSTTWRQTDQPAAAAAYTVHKVILGNISVANSGTTVTVDRWFDYTDGTVVTPSAGTLYEVLVNHGGYTGIHASAATPRAAGGIRNIRVHGGCHITRVWNDQLSIYGSDSRLVVDQSVLIDHGEDFGITSHGDRARIFCSVVHNGAEGIYATGDDCQISAYASGSPYVNIGDAYLGDILVSGSRTRLTGSVVVASGVWSRYGIVIAGPKVTGGAVDAVDATGTTATGYSVAGHRLYSLNSPTIEVTNTVLRDVYGTVSEVATSGTVLPAKIHGLTTISSRWSVPGCYWAGASVGQSMTLDTIWYEPFIVYSPITVTALSIAVVGAGTAGHTARLNIYSANSAWQPVTRLISDGTVAIDGAVQVSRTGLSCVLQPGMYLKAYNGQSTASIRAVPMSGVEVGSSTDVWSTHIDRMSVGSAYAAMPASGTAWTTATGVTTTGVLHGIWMKWTS